MRFTAQSIASLRAKPKEYLCFDDRGIRGGGRLAVRVRPEAVGGARKEFLFIYRVAGRRRKLTLGEFGDSHQGKVSLAEARRRYAQHSDQVRAGKDPIAEREAARLAEEAKRLAAARQGSLAMLVDAYVRHLEARGARSAQQIKSSLERDLYPVVPRTARARDVLPEHVRLAMRRAVERGSRAQANKVRGYLQSAFAFGLQADQSIEATPNVGVLFGLERNPARDVPKVSRPGETGVRDIELSADQIHRLWTAIDSGEVGELPPRIYQTKRKYAADTVKPIRLDRSIGACLQLLLATGGQRVEVAAAAKRSEFDLEQGIWTVPHARRKNRQHSRGPHMVPLNATAVAIIKAQCARAEDSEFLFPAPRKSKRAKHMHADVIYKGLHRWCKAIKFPVQFAPRDLRQTWMARAGELGLSKELRDRIQDRPPSDVGAKHYDSYSYLPEKTSALTAWDRRLKQIVSGAKVIPLKERRA